MAVAKVHRQHSQKHHDRAQPVLWPSSYGSHHSLTHSLTQCSPTTACSPKNTNLPIVRVSDGGVTKQKSRWREGKRTNEENQSQEMSSGEPPPPFRPAAAAAAINSQQHVLLILLEDGADVLKDVWVEEVYAAVYDVAHKCAGLLHVMHDLREQKSLEVAGRNGTSDRQQGGKKDFCTSLVPSFSTMQP